MSKPMTDNQKHAAIAAGVGVVGLGGYFLWKRNQGAAASTPATDASTQDPNNIDPATGYSYGSPEDLAAQDQMNQESYGALDPYNTDPYGYDGGQLPIDTSAYPSAAPGYSGASGSVAPINQPQTGTGTLPSQDTNPNPGGPNQTVTSGGSGSSGGGGGGGLPEGTIGTYNGIPGVVVSGLLFDSQGRDITAATDYIAEARAAGVNPKWIPSVDQFLNGNAPLVVGVGGVSGRFVKDGKEYNYPPGTVLGTGAKPLGHTTVKKTATSIPSAKNATAKIGGGGVGPPTKPGTQLHPVVTKTPARNVPQTGPLQNPKTQVHPAVRPTNPGGPNKPPRRK